MPVVARLSTSLLQHLVKPISRHYSSQIGKMPDYKLIYFGFRGLGEHIRFIFAVAGVPYVDDRIPREQWDELKSKYTYEKLPILTVDGKELSQSLTIARFLAKQFDLVAQDPWLDAKAEQTVDIATEVRQEFRTFIIEKKDEVRREALKRNLADNLLPKYYKYMENLVLETPGSFITGHKPVWQDFFVANWLEIWDEVVNPGLIDGFPALKKLKEAVFAVPAIKEYVSKRPKTFI